MPLNYPVLYKSMDAKTDAIVQQAVNTAIADAETLWAPEKFDGVFAIKGIGIKKLERWDVDAVPTAGTATNSWLFSITTAKTWTNVISDTICDECYVVLTGIFNYDANPDVRAIKITADGVEYPVYNVEEMYGWDVAVAYWSHPIIIRPTKKILVNMIAESAGTKSFGFIGYTIAKRSRLLTQYS